MHGDGHAAIGGNHVAIVLPKGKININKNLDIEAYQRFSVPQYRLDARHIRNYLQRLTRNDRDSMLPDRYTKRYYLDKKDFCG